MSSTPQSGDRGPAAHSTERLDEPPATSPFGPLPPPPDPEDPDLPNPFGRYALLRCLGRGGMGAVYLAHDTELDRLVALKVPQLSSGEPALVRERFQREARAAALLHHPNICPVYDVGEIDGLPYLTMAYIEGVSLHDWVRTDPAPSVAQVVALVRKLALALAEAHGRGVVHRDLKPSNVLVDRRGEPVVMDFGLARRVRLDEDRLTFPGVPMGTPAYMPPEQVLGRLDAIGPTSDVWSLGVILYELLTGQWPFQGSVGAILTGIVFTEAAPPSRFRPGLDPRLDAVCLRALNKEPRERFASMEEFARALADCLDAEPTPGGVAASRPDPPPTSPPAPTLDTRLAPRILDLLRTWGWARGIQRIRARAQKAGPPALRAAWQTYADWLSGAPGAGEPELGAFPDAALGVALQGWALTGRASLLLRDRDYAAAQRLLDRAAALDTADPLLQATIAHTRGSAWLHLGKFDRALPLLHQALALVGRRHFLTGRVLDTLGMAYAGKGNFPLARDFYRHALQHKEEARDDAGLAVTHGQLGRLYLDWGDLDEAERHFQEDLRLAQKLLSRYSEAQMYNHLGQVALARGRREAAAGRRSAARRCWTQAAGWLDESIRVAQELKAAVPEGFARKDRALVCLEEGDLGAAEAHVRRARELFESAPFAEGVALAQRAEGLVLRARGRHDEAERRLRAALAHFDATQERDEAARTQWEIARTLRSAGAAIPPVTRAYRDALARAEACRHAPLVRDVEQELREIDFEAYVEHVYRRARGHGIEEDAPALLDAAAEVLTVLLLDLPGVGALLHGQDPPAALLTVNQLLADCSEVLERHRVAVTAYRGSGLMALARGGRHAERAATAALDLAAALEEFNRPRIVLGLAPAHVRIALHTGEALVGNVGTYRKMDFTALGPAVDLAAALLHEAVPDVPCLSRASRDLLPERFVFRPDSPRRLAGPGQGEIEAWDLAK